MKEIKARAITKPENKQMAIMEVFVDTCDAMGANIINQVCEYLGPYIEELTGQKCAMCILSNLADTKLTQANVVLHDIDDELGESIKEASIFAELDPYRAATSNKGVMNGMDGLVIATGNDWRAVEAGIHAYSSKHGKYSSITRWDFRDHTLYGELKAPILVGVVGGVTKTHPVAQICLGLLGVESASELARVIAAVGLVQNLAAIKALVTEGIIAGHMKLHISNLAIAAGATNDELPQVQQLLRKHLEETGRVSEKDAKEVLIKIRNQK